MYHEKESLIIQRFINPLNREKSLFFFSDRPGALNGAAVGTAKQTACLTQQSTVS
jgi:hypothetical protein